jgi:hypothetical protein
MQFFRLSTFASTCGTVFSKVIISEMVSKGLIWYTNYVKIVNEGKHRN